MIYYTYLSTRKILFPFIDEESKAQGGYVTVQCHTQQVSGRNESLSLIFV